MLGVSTYLSLVIDDNEMAIKGSFHTLLRTFVFSHRMSFSHRLKVPLIFESNKVEVGLNADIKSEVVIISFGTKHKYILI